MKMIPPPLSQPPAPHGFWQDLRLLSATELRLTWNKIRQWPLKIWLLLILPSIAVFTFLFFLGKVAYGALETLPLELGQGFLSFAFLAGVISNTFFGVTSAFVTLYMSDDLELLFVAPVATRAIFAVKTLRVAVSNLFGAVFFIFLPGLFFGLLFKVPFFFYVWLVLITLGLLALGTALAGLINLMVMRIVPPHRSKEAVGFIGAFSGILIALVFQIPSLLIARVGELDIASWLAGQLPMFRAMNWFPWGWGSMALTESALGNHLKALLWSLPTLLSALVVFVSAFVLVEKGFRRGWISLSQGEGARKKTRVRKEKTTHYDCQVPILAWEEKTTLASPLNGMWAVAKKDLFTIKRDTREWFGYITPLIMAAFFASRFIFFPSGGAKESLVVVLILYTIMFSGNMALQSFGREGESEWLLNSVPLAGWPVVWGKLLAAVLPTLLLMELLLAGTAIALGLPNGLVLALAVGAALITFGGSAIGLYYSINNSRYNPDTPQQKISPGAAFTMMLVNGLLTGLLALCLIYTFSPDSLTALAQQLPPFAFAWNIKDAFLWFIYNISRPLFWAPTVRILFGLTITLVVWAAVFFGFMHATVRQSRKGFTVQLVSGFKKTKNSKV